MTENWSALPGLWMLQGEFEAITDGIRANIDRMERRGDLISSMKCACYRALIDSLEASLADVWRQGILCRGIPVFPGGVDNLGKVSSAPEAPPAGGRAAPPVRGPKGENGGGDS